MSRTKLKRQHIQPQRLQKKVKEKYKTKYQQISSDNLEKDKRAGEKKKELDIMGIDNEDSAQLG